MRGYYKCFYGKLTDIVTTHLNSRSEMVLMMGHNICFYGKLSLNYLQIFTLSGLLFMVIFKT